MKVLSALVADGTRFPEGVFSIDMIVKCQLMHLELTDYNHEF